jgi:DivIVA domain-containing protein
MPDQNSASTEHALIQEVSAPLSTLPSDPVPEVANVDFPVVLRGYDRLAVDAYVKRVSQLVAELSATRSPQAAVRKALERVGEDVSGILQRAHDTAQQITSQSRREAEDRAESARREAEVVLEGARRDAEALLAESKNRLRELDAETDRIWQERHRIVEDTRQLASQLLAVAESASERFPADEDEPTAVAAQPFDVEDEDATVVEEEGEDEDEMLLEDEHGMLLGQEEATHVEDEDATHTDEMLDEPPAHEAEHLAGEPGVEDYPEAEPDSQKTMPIEQVEPPEHEDD